MVLTLIVIVDINTMNLLSIHLFKIVNMAAKSKRERERRKGKKRQ